MYQGHLADGSSVQKHSAGENYPVVTRRVYRDGVYQRAESIGGPYKNWTVTHEACAFLADLPTQSPRTREETRAQGRASFYENADSTPDGYEAFSVSKQDGMSLKGDFRIESVRPGVFKVIVAGSVKWEGNFEDCCKYVCLRAGVAR